MLQICYSLIFFLRFALSPTSAETFAKHILCLFLPARYQIGTDTVLRCYLSMCLCSGECFQCYIFFELGGVATSLVYFFSFCMSVCWLDYTHSRCFAETGVLKSGSIIFFREKRKRNSPVSEPSICARTRHGSPCSSWPALLPAVAASKILPGISLSPP